MKNRIAKKVCAAALAGLMAMAMIPATFVFADGNTMTIGVTSFADTLEPTEQYFNSWVISRYGVGQGLTSLTRKKHGTMSCNKWTNSEDGKTWTFTIREGVKFSNGNDMTPELVKASLERTMEMSNRTGVL